MADGQSFIDYYSVLQVSPNCDARRLEAAYRLLAKMYHPDHAETADVTKFNDVVAAYKALRNPEQRAQYDLLYSARTGFRFQAEDEGDGEQSAYDDADAHSKILLFLYRGEGRMRRMPAWGAIMFKRCSAVQMRILNSISGI